MGLQVMYSHSDGRTSLLDRCCPPVQTRAMLRLRSFPHDFVNHCSVNSQVSSSDWSIHNLRYFTNLNQLIPLISVETRRLKCSFTQLPVTSAAMLTAEPTRVLFPRRF